MDQLTAPQKSAIRSAILAQCFGTISTQLIAGGVLLLYLNVLRVDSSSILLILSIGPLLSALLNIPLAFGADRAGLKLFGLIGNGLMVAGVALLIVSGCFPGAAIPWVVSGLVVHTVGLTFFSTGWFSLLSMVIPSFYLGRFFGILRFSWQCIGIAFFVAVTFFFGRDTPVIVFQVLFAVAGAGILARCLFYNRIPELGQRASPDASLPSSVRRVLSLRGYLPYLAYVFLLTFFTAQATDILRLLGKKVLDFGDNVILVMSVAGMVGALAGFALGGRVIDRAGAKVVFIVCHFAYGLTLVLFPLRGFLPLPPEALACAASLLFGLIAALVGIAITTETFGFCEGGNRALAVAVITTFQTLGGSLSGFLLSAVLKVNLLAAAWPLGARQASQYDTILLGFGVMVVLLVVTLGLVPSVVKQRSQVPVD